MEIQLGGKRGGIAIIDEKYFQLVSPYSWSKDQSGYVRSSINGKMTNMHRFIMNYKGDLFVDHINGIRHDNRRSNLRTTTALFNGQNKIKKEKSSKYRGVFKRDDKYIVATTLNYQTHYLGRYEDEIEAAEAYDMFIVHGGYDHIPINFPNKKEEYLKNEFKPKSIPKSNKTNYKGVSKRGNTYNARIIINGKNVPLINSIDPMICAKAYDEYIVSNNIPNKKLNFPDDHPEYNPLSKIKTFCEPINENTVRILIKNKTGDKLNEVLIDREDYDKIKYYSLYINQGYVSLRISNIKTNLHRFLLNCNDPKIFVDHKDNNKLNNKKENLRFSNPSNNAQNKSKIKNTSSKYIGMSYNITEKTWVSRICFDGNLIYIGRDDNDIYSARRRDLFIMEIFPDQCYKLNFEWSDTDIKEWKRILPINIKVGLQRQISRLMEMSAKYTMNGDLERSAKFNSIIEYKKREKT